MKIKKIEKKLSGKYINYYDITFENRVGNEQHYEMVSRDGDIKSAEDLSNRKPQAVVILAFDKNYEHVLVNKEYRIPTGEYVYNLPAGLIEEGEDYEKAVSRELKEETGLEVVEWIDKLPPAYSSVGISNEKTVVVVCRVRGELGGTPEDSEDIEPVWLSKMDYLWESATEEILPMSTRLQMFLHMWCNAEKYETVFHDNAYDRATNANI